MSRLYWSRDQIGHAPPHGHPISDPDLHEGEQVSCHLFITDLGGPDVPSILGPLEFNFAIGLLEPIFSCFPQLIHYNDQT